jgi:hypothetical protein
VRNRPTRLCQRWQVTGTSRGGRLHERLEQVRLHRDRVNTDGAGQSTVSHGTPACRITACAIVLALAPVQPAEAGAVSIEAARDGDAIDIHASALLSADSRTVWRVLTDYDRYTDFVPDLQVSRVVARRGETVTVEQSGAAALWLFKLPLDITFEVHEVPPRLLRSRAVAGSLPGLASCYVLTPAPSGTRLDYAGRIVPGFALLGPFEQKAVEQSVARQFQALADEIERQGAAVGANPMDSAK